MNQKNIQVEAFDNGVLAELDHVVELLKADLAANENAFNAKGAELQAIADLLVKKMSEQGREDNKPQPISDGQPR